MGTVVGGPGSTWCHQCVGRRSCIDPCMPGWFDVRPSCVWSVYGRVVVAAAVWLVLGCVSRLMVSLFIVGFFLLLPALSRPRLSCGRCVRSGLPRAKVRVCAARYGQWLWSWGRGFKVGRCVGWSVVGWWNLGVVVRWWVWSPAGVAHHVVTNAWDAVPVSTLACLAGWVLSGLLAVCSSSGSFSAAAWSVPGCVSRLMVGLCVLGWIALQPAPV